MTSESVNDSASAAIGKHPSWNYQTQSFIVGPDTDNPISPVIAITPVVAYCGNEGILVFEIAHKCDWTFEPPYIEFVDLDGGSVPWPTAFGPVQAVTGSRVLCMENLYMKGNPVPFHFHVFTRDSHGRRMKIDPSIENVPTPTCG